MRCMVLMWKYRIVVSIELAFTDIVIGDGDDDERLPFEKIRISNSIAFQNGIKIFSIISTSAPNRFLIRGNQFVIRRTKSPATLFHRTRHINVCGIDESVWSVFVLLYERQMQKKETDILHISANFYHFFPIILCCSLCVSFGCIGFIVIRMHHQSTRQIDF